MSKRNDDFFVEKKIWSIVKDELLGCYLKPYFSKIFFTKKPVIYVDCFAGKGKFDDGTAGSPIIALDIIVEAIKKSKIISPKVESNFIDLNYADDLEKNLSQYKNVNIISGKYEENIGNILKDKNNYNVFLYVDPYGIKALDYSQFDDFAKRFNSIELLINLNSFGFIREACHVFGEAFDDPNIFEDLIEYDPTKFDPSEKSTSDLNKIAGGDYWQNIIMDYKAKKINGYQAEERFAKEYCKRLADSFKYVLNMPLRLKEGQKPKYRMIHATNHHDGCVLMADNICKRWEMWQDYQTGGQISLFDQTVNNEYIDSSKLKTMVENHFKKYTIETQITVAIAEFFTENGVVCPSKDINNILSEFEEIGKLFIRRHPGLTPSGKKTKFMIESSKRKVFLRWV